jgi:uncharacterized protein YoxC
MGMFDSFIIQHEGVEREIQTKKFDNTLDRYQVGDVVFGAEPGIQIVHDYFYLDSEGEMTWEDEKKEREIQVFLVIRFSVFMHYCWMEGAMTTEAIEKKVTTLQLEALSDSAKFELICIESIKQKTARIQQQFRAIQSISSAVNATKMTDEELKKAFFVSDDDKRAQAGKLVEVIEEIVSDFESDETSWP